MIAALSDVIFPKKCVFCGRALPVGAPVAICGGCAAVIPYYAGRYLYESGKGGAEKTCDRIICALKYSGFVKIAVSRYKFYDRREYGMTFAAILCERIARAEEGSECADGNTYGCNGAQYGDNEARVLSYDYVTCVPISRERLRERGYNQAAVLAIYAAKYFGIPFNGGLIERDEHALRQSALRRVERNINARTAYRLSDAEGRELIAGARILLIDDIATSMSTINACAAALKSGGAAEVVGAVLASPP